MILTYIFLASMSDLILTYFYLDMYRKRFPKNDWTLSEQNPIIRACVKMLGLETGMVVSGPIVLGLVMLVTYFLGSHGRFFLGGFLTMAVIVHFLNFAAVRRLWKKEQKK